MNSNYSVCPFPVQLPAWSFVMPIDGVTSMNKGEKKVAKTDPVPFYWL